MSKRGDDQVTPLTILAAGTVLAAAIGYRSFLNSRLTPGERRVLKKAREESLARSRAKRAQGERRVQLENARWQQFDNDPIEREAIEREFHVSIPIRHIPARISTDGGSPFGHTWDSITAVHDGRRLTIHNDHDGGPPSWHYGSATQRLSGNLVRRRGHAVIGTGEGPPSAAQRHIADLLAAIQREGSYQGRIALERADRKKIVGRRYASYARERGWPTSFRSVGLRSYIE